MNDTFNRFALERLHAHQADATVIFDIARQTLRSAVHRDLVPARGEPCIQTFRGPLDSAVVARDTTRSNYCDFQLLVLKHLNSSSLRQVGSDMKQCCRRRVIADEDNSLTVTRGSERIVRFRVFSSGHKPLFFCPPGKPTNASGTRLLNCICFAQRPPAEPARQLHPLLSPCDWRVLPGNLD